MLARALSGKVPVVCNDIAGEPGVVEREKLLASGSRSFALLPLVVKEQTVGVISIHSQFEGFFDQLETELLRSLAGDISFGLAHLLQTDRIDYLAKHDALTGLPNRVRFTQDLSQRLSRSSSTGQVCVALLDLVRFRRINETLGRWAGDNLLTQVAGRLRGLEIFAARLGNDVFALLLDDRGSAAELVRDFEHISSRCFEQPYFLGGEEVRMGCRIGAAVFPGDGNDAESLLRNAESALRKARTAIELFVFYEQGMNATASEAQAMESKIRRAIQREEFVLHYQPKYRLADRRICGVEALIRWQDPEGGLVPPMQFIPVLEETGLIGVVGKWALRRALADAEDWRVHSGTALRVAVNVSSLQLNQQDFSAQVAELLGSAGGSALELEITESVIMDDVDRKIVMLQELREMGIQIAIDDFGTGYSSLAYISKLPINSLKIDRTFITAMADDPQSYGLVAGMIALARPLELKIVAEGVETEAQARLLRLLRCDEAQGYLFSRPVDAATFLELLLADNAQA
jgi:diguanylate cyclase (GGDEF)-like protein